MFRQCENRAGEAATLDSLGYVAHQTGQHAEALTCYGQTLALYREIGDAYSEADTLDRLGQAHAALGQSAEARCAWHQAMDLYRSQHRGPDARRIHQLLAGAPDG
jgi:tetratricopeptide (TPR) repeat protein